MKRRKNSISVPLEDKAVDLIARSRLTRGELRYKLLLRKYPEEQIEEILDRFEELGYLNDPALASDFARSKIAYRPMGKKRLVWELVKRRIPPELAELAVETAFESVDEIDLARKAFETFLVKQIKPEAIWRKMLNLGFERETIAKLLANAGYNVDIE